MKAPFLKMLHLGLAVFLVLGTGYSTASDLDIPTNMKMKMNTNENRENLKEIVMELMKEMKVMKSQGDLTTRIQKIKANQQSILDSLAKLFAALGKPLMICKLCTSHKRNII